MTCQWQSRNLHQIVTQPPRCLRNCVCWYLAEKQTGWYVCCLSSWESIWDTTAAHGCKRIFLKAIFYAAAPFFPSQIVFSSRLAAVNNCKMWIMHFEKVWSRQEDPLLWLKLFSITLSCLPLILKVAKSVSIVFPCPAAAWEKWVNYEFPISRNSRMAHEILDTKDLITICSLHCFAPACESPRQKKR